jgi:PAS domain S-box-containing protein
MLRRRLVDSRGNGGDSLDLLDLLSDGEPPAFATDEDDRIVFWNGGAEKVFGRSGPEVLGRPCFSVVRGRDLQGNHFCYRDCPVVAQRRIGESLSGCEVVVPTSDGKSRTLSVTLLQLPDGRQDGASLVHLLKPVESESILGQALTRAGLVGLPSGSRPPVQPPLTSRETEILRWVAAGLQNKEVAQKLGISLATVRNHIHNILDKLQVHSKLEAVSLAFRSGWVTNATLEDDEGDEAPHHEHRRPVDAASRPPVVPFPPRGSSLR